MKEVKDNLKEFLEIKNQTETSCDLYFYGDIVSSWWGAWDDTDQYPEAVRDFLNEAKGKDLNIHVNSGGGSVFAGITIYNMIKNHVGNKIVYIDGLAASIASVIALAGDKVIMNTGSSFMIHKPFSWICGNADDMRKCAEDLDVIQNCIMQVYKENLNDGVDIKTIEDMVNTETWLTGEEAKEYFNIEVQENQAVACVSEMFDKYKNTPNSIKEKYNNLKNENKTTQNINNVKNNNDDKKDNIEEIKNKELKERLQIELDLV